MQNYTPQTRLLMISTDKKMFDKESVVALRQAAYARGMGELHIIVFAGNGFSETVIAPNVWVYPTRSRSRWKYPFDAIRLGRFIISKRGITDITTEDPSLTAMAGMSLKKRFGIPLEINVHTDIGSPYFARSIENKVRKSMALSYLPKADAIRVVSDRIKTYLVGSLGIAESKITVRPIPVDVAWIKDASVRDGADLHKKYPQFAKIILMASRLEPEKDISLALKSLPAVIAAIPGAGLIIVGNGSQRTKLEREAQALGVRSNVVFEPWVDAATLASYYKTADAFLATSWYEGYGLTLAEASAAECSVVSTDVGIARESGAHIAEHEPASVARMLVSVLS